MIPIRRAVLSSIYASRSFIFNLDDEVSSETYDANGNVTSTGGKSFTYDSENHLVSMSTTGTSASIIYDAFGNRVSKTVNGVTTQYLVEDDKNPTGYPQVFDELTNGAVARTYTYGLQRIDEEQVIDGSWTPSFYGYDGGGNVRQLTSAAGAVTDKYEYDAGGNSFTVSGSTPPARIPLHSYRSTLALERAKRAALPAPKGISGLNNEMAEPRSYTKQVEDSWMRQQLRMKFRRSSG
jgi:YD repeat-containing protein